MSRVLIVGGDPELRDLLRRMLESVGHEVETRSSSLLGVKCLANAEPRFDLLIVNSIYLRPLDLGTFLRCIRPLAAGRTPVILTSAGHRDAVSQMLGNARENVFAVLPKPFQISDLMGLVKRALFLGALERMGRDDADAEASEETAESKSANEAPEVVALPHRMQAGFALCLLDLMDRRSHGLREHAIRVQRHAVQLGTVFGLDDPSLRPLRYGALLHDFGRCALPDRLVGADPCQPAEDVLRVQAHPAEGAGLLRGLPLFEDSLDVIHLHHERFDGSGHPRGLGGNDIPVGARICAVADSFDNACEGRLGRKPLGARGAYRAIREQAGIALDPELVAAFGSVLERDVAGWAP